MDSSYGAGLRGLFLMEHRLLLYYSELPDRTISDALLHGLLLHGDYVAFADAAAAALECGPGARSFPAALRRNLKCRTHCPGTVKPRRAQPVISTFTHAKWNGKKAQPRPEWWTDLGGATSNCDAVGPRATS